MSEIVRELRAASRIITRSPGTAVIAVLALALGIGLTTVMFSIVYGALYRGLPFADADRLLHLERANPSQDIESMGVPIHDYLDWRDAQGSFEELAAFYTGTVNLSGGDRPERYRGAFITANGFEPLGVRPAVGRLFAEGEDVPGAPPVVLLSHHVWRDRYDRDPAVVGRTIRVNGEAATVVGVMPEGFRFPILEDVWVPLRLDPAELARGEGTWLEVYGRLREGVTVERARAEMSTIAQRIAGEHPETNEGVVPLIKPYTEEFIGPEETRVLWVMLGAVSLVLLIACANVANLLLARTTVRVRDLAIRTAIGAKRSRIVGGLLLEALVLALAGLVLGAGIAWGGIELFDRAVADTNPPFWLVFDLDLPILLFMAALTGGAALVAGLFPALQASSADVAEILRDESRGTSSFRLGRLSRVLVTAEVAFSAGLLAASGLMMKGMVNLRGLEYPFATENVLTARLALFESEFPEEEQVQGFYRDLVTRLRSATGSPASLTTALPGLGSGGQRIALEGEVYATEEDRPFLRRVVVAPGFLEVFDVGVLQGRALDERDGREDLPAAMINESMAERHFEGQDPLGRRFREGPDDEKGVWRTVVGVVPDLYMEGVGNPDADPEGYYVPLAQVEDARFMSIVVRARGDALSLTPTVRETVSALDPDLPLYYVDTLQGAIDDSTWFYGIFGTLLATFGVAALFLASVGLYGVMAFSVSRRTREMGVRMALGAAARDVLRLVLRQGAIQVTVGLLLGLGLAVLLGQGLQLILFEVKPWDPVVYLLISAVLAGTGILATAIPAHRATRVDPTEALRQE